MIQFGMPTLVENATLEENAALCRRLGLSFIELNMSFPEYQAPVLEDTAPLLRAAEEAGIYYTVHLDEQMDIADFNALVAEAYLETARRSIAVAGKLCPLLERFGDPTQPLTLNMHISHGVFTTLPDRKVQMYERGFDLYMKAMARFRALCEEWIGGRNIMISIENTDGYFPCERKAVEYLLESPVFALTWDIGHSAAHHEGDMPFIMDHREKLRHFHIHDGSAVPPRDHLVLGTGEIDLQARLALAEKCNAHCVLETKTADALEKSIVWLREHRLWRE